MLHHIERVPGTDGINTMTGSSFVAYTATSGVVAQPQISWKR
jgi:hypothetical protein